MTSVPSSLNHAVALRADRHAALLTGGRGRHDPPFLVRDATPSDLPALLALAERDGTPLAAGPLALAEVAGIPIAAIGLENRRVVADPAWPTHDAVDALHLAAAEHAHWPARLARWRSALSRRRPAERAGDTLRA